MLPKPALLRDYVFRQMSQQQQLWPRLLIVNRYEINCKGNDVDVELSLAEIDRVIQMAWEDRTSFDAIEQQFGLSPGQVIALMRQQLKPSSFRLWRKRTTGRTTKHDARFSRQTGEQKIRRFRCPDQKG